MVKTSPIWMPPQVNKGTAFLEEQKHAKSKYSKALFLFLIRILKIALLF